MKKIGLIVMTAFLFVCGAVGCGKQPTGPDGNSNSDTQQSASFEDDSQDSDNNSEITGSGSSEDDTDDDGFWTGVHLPD